MPTTLDVGVSCSATANESVAAAVGPWLHRPKPMANAPRLFCFPFAGGGASAFEKWHRSFPTGLEINLVQYPGHENRWREPCSSSFNGLVRELAEVIGPWVDERSAFWGHSFGALVAFETARALRRRGTTLPGRLFVSGARAPQLSIRDPMHALNDKAFLERLRAFGGVPDEVLAEPSLIKAFLPVVKNDFRIFEEYCFAAEEPLPVAMSVFGGLSDGDVSISDVLSWSSHTNRAFRSRFLGGGHFFAFTDFRQMAAFIEEDLDAS